MNVLVTLLAYGVTMSVTLLWIFFSRQERVPRTARTVVCVSVRTLPLFLLVLLVCEQSGVDARVVFAVFGIALWVFLISPGLSFPIIAVGILYAVQQWILGWPDRHKLFLDPPSPQRSNAMDLQEAIGGAGIVTSPLRPVGAIALDGAEYPARSDLGYIERGERIKIVGRKGTYLVVRPVEAESDMSTEAPDGTPRG